MPDTGIGAPVRRKEDARFLTGRANYTDDINRPGQVYACFVRSPHARATIKSINLAGAKAAPGVLGVFTGEDAKADGIGGPICGWVVTQRDGQPHTSPPTAPLAVGTVNHVGQAVAVVIAQTYGEAKDAAELVEVDYDELPPVIGIEAALADGAPQLYDEVAGNLCFDWEVGDKAATDEAFTKAAHVTSLDLVNNRLIPNAMEPRACIGEYERAGDKRTLYVTTQNPHVTRLVMAAFMGFGPENRLRVVAPDVGGGFGSKIYVYCEEIVVLWAAKKVNRPVKWTAERSESFVTDAHGRDHVTHAELALDKDGTFLGLRVSTLANLGAYNQIFSTATPTYLYGTLLAGVYKTPAIYANVKGGFTNTTPVDAYRGAGRPEATYVLERLVDKAAREMGIDRLDLRRRNFIPSDQFPYQTPVLVQYDSGDFDLLLDRALELIKYDQFPSRRAESERRGKLRGIGVSCAIEACGLAPSKVVGALGGGVGQWESAQIRLNPTGGVTLLTGSHSHGQGHETVFAQIVSDRLGVPLDQIEVEHGDTSTLPFGMGSYGSRSGPVGGAAVAKAADKVIEKAKKVAAHMMEASVEDIEYDHGAFRVAGTDKQKTIAEVAFTAYVPFDYPEDLEPGLDETAFFDPVNFTFPSGAYVVEVEVDPETGVVTVEDIVAVDDVGTVMNPLIVHGQIHGGVAQGIGQALLEACVYDETGQLLTGSYMDYCMPRADNLPSIKTDTTDIPCPHNPLGVKGCGETGAIFAPPALVNAVIDAIGTDIDMPVTGEKIWRALQGAQRQAAE